MARRPGQDEEFAEFLARQESDPETREELDIGAEAAQRGPSMAAGQRARIRRTKQTVTAGVMVVVMFLCLRFGRVVLRALTSPTPRPAVESPGEPVDPEFDDRRRLDEAINESVDE